MCGKGQRPSGFLLPGFPCAGAWISYALGSLSDNVPAFVVLPDARGLPGAAHGHPDHEAVLGSQAGELRQHLAVLEDPAVQRGRVHLVQAEAAAQDRAALRVLSAQRWPTMISEADFRSVTNEARFPQSLSAAVKNGTLIAEVRPWLIGMSK